MTRIAVTGASGFVGRHVVEHAVRAGLHVIGVVRSDGAAQAIRQLGGQPMQIVGRDPEALGRTIEGCDALVHLAQIGAERGGQTYDSVNVGFTERVVEDARRAGVGRFVSFSGLGVASYGRRRRCSNPYFLSKLVAETIVFRAGLEAVVFRPSYIVGPGDAFVPMVLRALADGPIERPGDGSYRMQPIAVADAAECVLAAVRRPAGEFPTIFDLVGPEAVTYARLLERLAAVARAHGRPADLRVREVPVAEAERQARRGGYQGMLPDELDCLLCDEVSDAAPLERLLGRPLAGLDDALRAAVRHGPAAAV